MLRFVNKTRKYRLTYTDESGREKAVEAVAEDARVARSVLPPYARDTAKIEIIYDG